MALRTDDVVQSIPEWEAVLLKQVVYVAIAGVLLHTDDGGHVIIERTGLKIHLIVPDRLLT